MTDGTLGGVELPARGEHDRMAPPLWIGQGNPLPCLQRSEPDAGELDLLSHC